MLRRSVQVLSTFLFQPDKYGELCKALLDPRACCDRITFPVLESLEQNIFKILSIRTVALADLHRNLSPVLLLSLYFSKFGFSKFVGHFSGFKIRFAKSSEPLFSRKIATLFF